MNQFTSAPGQGGSEKVNYELMSFDELEKDPVAGPVLQQKALEFLKTDKGRKEDFEEKFTGELNAQGYLIQKNPNLRAIMRPSDLFTGSFQGESDDIDTEIVTKNTREELKTLEK